MLGRRNWFGNLIHVHEMTELMVLNWLLDVFTLHDVIVIVCRNACRRWRNRLGFDARLTRTVTLAWHLRTAAALIKRSIRRCGLLLNAIIRGARLLKSTIRRGLSTWDTAIHASITCCSRWVHVWARRLHLVHVIVPIIAHVGIVLCCLVGSGCRIHHIPVWHVAIRCNLIDITIGLLSTGMWGWIATAGCWVWVITLLSWLYQVSNSERVLFLGFGQCLCLSSGSIPFEEI